MKKEISIEFIAKKIDELFELDPTQLTDEAEDIFIKFRELLSSGKIRAAEKINGVWVVNHWVKKGILLGFKIGKLKDMSINEGFRYFDKHTYPLKKLTLNDGIRIVPGGTTIREGAYVAKGVVIMPPSYINVGAYIDEGTMIDSHVLVGSCAQIGKNVHISASAQIGGVLEPIGQFPVIIEDNVLIGGNAGIYEGTIVKTGAVVGAGVILTSSTPVYDIVKGEIYRSSNEGPLVIPENAILVMGSRMIKNNDFAIENELSLYTPIIVKYRDSKTDLKTALEGISKIKTKGTILNDRI
jgi:2,3,4,5-tetrahydropyridine-2-carboxylate N-succinyltransferase